MNQDYCPACDRLIAQTKNGMLWNHKARRGAVNYCHGSRTNPDSKQKEHQ